MRTTLTNKDLSGFLKEYYEYSIDKPYEDHRRGSNYYVQHVLEIKNNRNFQDWLKNTEEELKEFEGFWLTEVFLDDYEHGCDHPPTKAHRVESVEITSNEWQKIEN